MPAGCEVRQAPSKGLGLFATASHAPDAEVFYDMPLFVMQHTGNRRVVAACANCCAFVGPLHAQLETIFGEARFAPLLQTLSGVGDRWQVPLTPAGVAPGAGSHVRCLLGCGELYCSENCRDAHFRHSHNILCVGPVSNEDDPLLKFKYHALEHSDTLLLAAQAMAFLINRARAAGGGSDITRGLMQEMLGFCHAPFRDACRAPPGRAKDAEFYAHTDSLINTAGALLRAALTARAPAEAAALFEAGPAFLSELLGMFEYNNIDVEIASPIKEPLATRARALLAAGGQCLGADAAAELQLLERLLREKEWVMRCVWGEETTGNFGDDEVEGAIGDADAMMGEAIDAGRGDDEIASVAMTQARAEVERMSMEQLLEAGWPAMHGTALFGTVARMNHSCSPNSCIHYLGNSARLTCRAEAPLAAGEELTICYVDRAADVLTRRRRLAEYGFVCSCERCAREDTGGERKAGRRLK